MKIQQKGPLEGYPEAPFEGINLQFVISAILQAHQPVI